MNPPEELTKEQITDWLRQVGKDRAWLGDELGQKKSTVDSWFSTRGFPSWALKSISRLMNPLQDKAAGLEVQFSHEQWMVIQEAMRLSGYTHYRDFYQDAIVERAEEILADEAAGKVLQYPDRKSKPARVAEVRPSTKPGRSVVRVEVSSEELALAKAREQGGRAAKVLKQEGRTKKPR